MTSAAVVRTDRRVRIAVVDDHPAVRVGLERLLRREPGFRFVAALEDARALADLLEREEVDVVVLDYQLPRSDGLAVCQRLKHRENAPAVLIYTAWADGALAVPAAVAQADAIISKAAPIATLLDAIRRAARGERLLDVPTPDLLASATARVADDDAALVPLLVHGALINEVARTLGLTPDDVKRRARRIVGRLHRATAG